jgi:two-component system osmolarity sensor histidine kinase EnvZ
LHPRSHRADAPAGQTDSMNAPWRAAGAAAAARISLFWRTFFLLALLLVGSIVAWLQMFRTLEYEPRVIDRPRSRSPRWST